MVIASIDIVEARVADAFIATPNVEAFMSAGVNVRPQRSVALPYDTVPSDVGQVDPEALSFPDITPAFTSRTELSTVPEIVSLFRSTETVTPATVAFSGIANWKLLALR